MTLVGLLLTLLKIFLVFNAVMGVVTYLAWVERRVSAFIQDRLGPNRVGPYGLLQPFADVVKFIFKEDLIPAQVNRPVFILAPALSVIPALITFAVIPFGGTLELAGWQIPLIITDVNIGVLYILAISSLGVYGIVLAGWASNNKYSLLGGLRSAAQMISYELSLGLSLVGVLLLTGSLSLREVVNAQYGLWNIVKQPLAFFIFLVAMFAETNRLPFDLPECETELVAGYHTEYSAMKFAMFFMAEYTNMVTAAAMAVTLFIGGWQIPFVSTLDPSPLWLSLLEILAFAVKVGVFLFLFVWVRWTIPRFRYDQLMRLGWKVLLPLALLNIFVTAGVVALL
ncbi:MAG: NADH-quinone oxidoreductase subunit NuoH [Nitrospinae bacterium]|nr:NADH-quinone oxidoreductase subunit NuoH [Nitrospinota bacterium]